MKWVAVFLAAIVLAMPLGFAEQATTNSNVNAEAKAVSATDLHFKQIGQAFGDFVFHVKSFLIFDEKAKVELLKERNAEMQVRQQAWLEAKASAIEKFESGNMTADEKSDIESMLRAEHEAIIKEHLRLTAEIRDIQLKAKARGQAQLESEANEAAETESHSGLSLGLVKLGGHLAVDSDNEIEERGFQGAKAEVGGNVAINSETQAALDKLVASLDQSGNVKIELSVMKTTSRTAVKEEVKGQLTAEQTSLYADLKTKAETLVNASVSGGKLEIEIKARHATEIETHIDSEAEAQAVVEKRLNFETSNVTTELRNGETVYVVTGAETKTAGSYELTKSFMVVIEADTGLTLSADMSAHFETIASTSSSGSSQASNSGVSGSGSASESSSASISGGASGSVGSSASGSAVAVGGITIG